MTIVASIVSQPIVPRCWTSSAAIGLFFLTSSCSSSVENEQPFCSKVQPVVGGTEDGGSLLPGNIQAAAGALVFRVPQQEEAVALCSATLIDAAWVVTAAHCLPSELQPGGEIEVSLSFAPEIATRSANDPCSGSGELEPEFFEKHPHLDLMLIKLTSLFSFPQGDVELWDANSLMPPSVGEEAVLVGYGWTESSAPGTRMFLDTRVVRLGETIIEVESGEGRGACRGDSGGPLIMMRDGQWRIVGVLSEGAPSCRGTDRFVDLTKPEIRSWMHEVMSMYGN